jgi:hypothetical protein
VSKRLGSRTSCALSALFNTALRALTFAHGSEAGPDLLDVGSGDALRPSMRWLVVVLALILTPARTFAAPDAAVDRTLSAKEVAKYFAPYVPEVRGCFLTNAKSKEATGVLRLEIVIHRDGSIWRFGFEAPGVSEPSLSRLDTCLRTQSQTWRFPVRAGFTSAVLPFIFLKTNAPGAGPIEGCWNPKGCSGAWKGNER